MTSMHLVMMVGYKVQASYLLPDELTTRRRALPFDLRKPQPPCFQVSAESPRARPSIFWISPDERARAGMARGDGFPPACTPSQPLWPEMTHDGAPARPHASQPDAPDIQQQSRRRWHPICYIYTDTYYQYVPHEWTDFPGGRLRP